MYLLWSICLFYIRARPWENVSYVICEQQRRRSACASAQSDQRLCCSLPRSYNVSSFCTKNFKPHASFYNWAGQFESDLVGNSRSHVFSWRGPYAIAIPRGVVLSASSLTADVLILIAVYVFACLPSAKITEIVLTILLFGDWLTGYELGVVLVINNWNN